MKTIFGFFSCALAGATAKRIAAAAHSGQREALNLRFMILYPFTPDSPDELKAASMFAPDSNGSHRILFSFQCARRFGTHHTLTSKFAARSVSSESLTSPPA